MNCMNCGAFLVDKDLDYCPKCGCNVLIQKKVDYLSRKCYNEGLEKASVRDLSGAISCLKQSLMYNKHNIQARNLLGLVYFETGEVVAALSEWVISKNLQPSRNLASEYINKLQANSNKLEAINETIRKYNDALNLCREGHEDMAAIRLKKILTQNPKLIKGYHLLALVQIKEGEYNKARRTLRKAAKIDKTNTTTLRFLSEIDEQTGVSTRLDRQNKRSKKQVDSSESDMVIRTPQYKEKSRVSLFFTLIAGFAAGLLAFYLLAVPAIPCCREKSQVTFDGEIRPRIECRGFDLTLPNGLHDGQTRIPSLLRRPGLFVRGRSAAEILPCELVLLLGQFQRVGLLPLGIELGLQGRDLLFQCFDLGIAARRGRGVESRHFTRYPPVGSIRFVDRRRCCRNCSIRHFPGHRQAVVHNITQRL